MCEDHAADRLKELEADRDRWKDRHELNMKVENLRIRELETENLHLKTGFQGACYCCEPVGELNLKLLAKLAAADKKLRDMQATIATFNIV